MTPKFSTLILITLITAVILLPFAVSSLYLPMIREQAFGLLEFVRTDLYQADHRVYSIGLCPLRNAPDATKARTALEDCNSWFHVDVAQSPHFSRGGFNRHDPSAHLGVNRQ